ncbi:MAG TPA: PAS domain S-box protein [Chthoniobacterales bacterium]|nr:PAS domain S-box protein [Chthoniobacterales bacterium]
MEKFEPRPVGEVAQRITMNEALSRLQGHHELILNAVSDGILALDVDESIMFANPRATEMLGWDAHELVGKPVHRALHHHPGEDTLYGTSSAIHNGMRDRASRRVSNDVFWRKDGSSFHVDYTCAPMMDEHERVIGSIVIFKDVTDEVIGNSRLKLQAQQYRLLFETNPSPMWVFDTKSLQILAVNEAALAEYGYSREQFLTLTVRDLRPAEDVSDFAREGMGPCVPSPFSGQFRHMKKDGSIILVEIYSAGIVWEGTSARIVTVINASERERTKQIIKKRGGK